MPVKTNHITRKVASALILAAFILFNSAAHAQSAGYLGKKAVVKTNLVNGLRLGFSNVDLEYVLGRKFSLTAFYEGFDYERGTRGVKRQSGVLKPRNRYGSYREISTLKNGRTQGWLVGLGAKIYFNSIIPAPYGYYFSFTFGYGHASMTGFDVSYETKKKSDSSDLDNVLQRPEVTGLSGETTIYFAEVPALGYQRVFKKFITVDSKISLQTQYCKLPENMLNAFENNHYVRANAVTYGVGNFSFGLAVYIKIGFLLF